MTNNKTEERDQFEVLWSQQQNARKLHTQKAQFSDAGERKQVINSCREAAFQIYSHARKENEEMKEDLKEMIMLVDVVAGQGHADHRDRMAINEIKKKWNL